MPAVPATSADATSHHYDVDVREIDTGTPPTRFARGWHFLGVVGEFDDGKPHSVEVFNVACPFHGWQWEGDDGRCAAVPNFKRHPKLARTRSWPTLVRNGQVFAYNDPEGNPPPEIGVPAAPVVRAVLRRCCRRHRGDDAAVRVRDRHYQGPGELEHRGAGESRAPGGGRGGRRRGLTVTWAAEPSAHLERVLRISDFRLAEVAQSQVGAQQ